MEQGFQHLQGLRVGEMSVAGANPLLDGGWIMPVSEHLEIMIALKHQPVAGGEVIVNQAGDRAGIGAVAETAAPAFDSETHRVSGVMGDGKGMDGKTGEREAPAGGEKMVFVQIFKGLARRLHGGRVGENRHLVPAGEDTGAPDMVAVLMGDENPPDRFGPETDRPQAALYLHPGESGVNQQRLPL